MIEKMTAKRRRGGGKKEEETKKGCKKVLWGVKKLNEKCVP